MVNTMSIKNPKAQADALAKEIHTLRVDLKNASDFRSFRNKKEKIEKLHAKCVEKVAEAGLIRVRS